MWEKKVECERDFLREEKRERNELFVVCGLNRDC